ncbi:MAG TPA: 30S ribosomal protein S19e [Candidatus Woesearchaeota archaeon]|nr:30S ribosomal protein S19e [Candidatus Woesearchaeota archaeon]
MRVSKQELIPALAEELKSFLKKPEWADFVKTGVHKERPPVNPEWWYIRGASILLKVDKLGPIGVSKLRNKYGGKKNRGVKPERFYKGSGSIIRRILQQLESAGLLKQETKGKHKGRVLTPKAHSLIARTIKKIDKPRSTNSESKPDSKQALKPESESKDESQTKNKKE